MKFVQELATNPQSKTKPLPAFQVKCQVKFSVCESIPFIWCPVSCTVNSITHFPDFFPRWQFWRISNHDTSPSGKFAKFIRYKCLSVNIYLVIRQKQFCYNKNSFSSTVAQYHGIANIRLFHEMSMQQQEHWSKMYFI